MASSDSENDELVSIGNEASNGVNDDELPRFTIDSEMNRQYARFNFVGTELTVRLLPPPPL